jgi:signal transduction histidine kinase
MNTGTLNSMDAMIRTNDAGQAPLTRPLELSEIRMFLHDLRHLVQAIVGSVDTLQMSVQDHATDLTNKSLERLRQNTDLAVDMLGHFGADPPTDNQAGTECDVAGEIERAVDTLAPLLKQNAVIVRQKVSRPLTAAICMTDLSRVLLNLLRNAIEATNTSGAPVTITAGVASGESLRITIQDSGCGIDKDTVAKIFDKGYTTKGQRGNKGLGLPIVRQVLDAYRGSIGVQSCPGKGSRFTIWLPKSKSEDGNCS